MLKDKGKDSYYPAEKTRSKIIFLLIFHSLCYEYLNEFWINWSWKVQTNKQLQPVV